MVGIIVSAAIIVGAAVFFAVGSKSGALGAKSSERPDKKGETLVGKSIYAAKDEKCRSDLGQLRAAIQIATDPVDDTHPATLEETRLGADFYKCPVGGEAYVYDPQTGKVHCPHPGHENY